MLAILVLGYFWYTMGRPLYRPGMVRSGDNLRAPLDPPRQTGGAEYWLVEKDIRLYHFSSGQGKKVLVVHGGPGYPFEKPLAALKGLKYRFHYYDQRGCGRSTKPFDRFAGTNYFENMKTLERTLGLGAQVADIERIRRILNVEKLTLVGHSFGAFLSVLYAAEFPERVEALVLVSPATVLRLPSEYGDFYKRIGDLLPPAMQGDFGKFLEQYMDFRNIFSRSEGELSALNLEFMKYYGPAAKAAGMPLPAFRGPMGTNGWMTFGMFFSMGKEHDYRDALRNLSIPALVIHGGKDIQDEKGSREYCDILKNSKFVVIKDAGHFGFYDRPDEFAKLLGDFLDSVDAKK
ncbi:MAG: alpha/beta hydrolase [Spirochaetes bacterium]|nr:alpha/beta hydrolase [Spirochaetota bacterium]